VSRADVDLARHGDELVITLRGTDPASGVGSYRRLLTLPAVLAKYRTAGARVERGELQVRFEERSEESGT
jgi:arsenite-transporting ATPase